MRQTKAAVNKHLVKGLPIIVFSGITRGVIPAGIGEQKEFDIHTVIS